MKINLLPTCLMLLGLFLAPATHAGRSCEEKPLTENTLLQALHTGQQVHDRISETEAKVLVLARVGQDLSKYGLRYSHLGYAYRTDSKQPWRITELLNQCGTTHSDLWRDGIANFFLDDMHAYDALVLIPPPELQTRLLAILQDPTRMEALHGKTYSLTAYPFSTKYQNSNQWILEILAAASSNTVKTREQAQAWLQKAGYEPTELKISTLTRLGGRMFKANVAFDDHPDELRYDSRIRTVTVDSFVNFIKKRNEGWKIFEIKETHPPKNN